MGWVPPELGYIQDMVVAGVSISLSEYEDMTAMAQADLILWKEAEAERQRAAAERGGGASTEGAGG